MANNMAALFQMQMMQNRQQAMCFPQSSFNVSPLARMLMGPRAGGGCPNIGGGGHNFLGSMLGAMFGSAMGSAQRSAGPAQYPGGGNPGAGGGYNFGRQPGAAYGPQTNVIQDRGAAAASPQYAQLQNFANQNGSLDGSFVTPHSSLQQDMSNLNKATALADRQQQVVGNAVQNASPSDQAALDRVNKQFSTQQAYNQNNGIKTDPYVSRQNYSSMLDNEYKKGNVSDDLGQKNAQLNQMLQMRNQGDVDGGLKWGGKQNGYQQSATTPTQAYNASPFNPNRTTGNATQSGAAATTPQARLDQANDNFGKALGGLNDNEKGQVQGISAGVKSDAATAQQNGKQFNAPDEFLKRTTNWAIQGGKQDPSNNRLYNVASSGIQVKQAEIAAAKAPGGGGSAPATATATPAAPAAAAAPAATPIPAATPAPTAPTLTA